MEDAVGDCDTAYHAHRLRVPAMRGACSILVKEAESWMGRTVRRAAVLLTGRGRVGIFGAKISGDQVRR